MSGAILVALAFGCAVAAPMPIIDREQGTELHVIFDDFDRSNCASPDSLPDLWLLQPHARKHRISYSWRVEQSPRWHCVD